MRIPKKSVMSLVALSSLALLLSQYCGPAPTATPLPTSLPVEELYWFYQDHNIGYATHVEAWKDDARSSVFEGVITDIRNSTVQFHIERRTLARDKYVECKFKRKEDVLRLNVGSVVRVLGDLEDVNGIVQFKNCSIVR